jgi:CMP-N-acetylneuraminic acid synthetase
MKIKALVAVRSGSIRVQNKNIRPFANSNLLELKLKQLKRLSNLDGIVVNSNDDKMLKIGEELGCETVKRDELYASNTVSMSDVYKNMAENFSGDIVAYINVTNPLINDKTLFEIIETYKKLDNFDSVNTAHYIKEFLFMDNKPINYDLKNQPRSQDLPDILALNFACNLISREKMIANKNVIGERPFIYPIDRIEATDIDDEIDFEFAEFVYTKTSLILSNSGNFT